MGGGGDPEMQVEREKGFVTVSELRCEHHDLNYCRQRRN
jgi:hypothetical protein